MEQWQDGLEALLVECRPHAPRAARAEAEAMATAAAAGGDWCLRLKWLLGDGPSRAERWLSAALSAGGGEEALDRITEVDFTGTWWKDTDISVARALFATLPTAVGGIRLGFVDAGECAVVAAAVQALRARRPDGGGWLAVEPENDEAARAAVDAILNLPLPPTGAAPPVELLLRQQPVASLATIRLPQEASVHVRAPDNVVLLPSENLPAGAPGWNYITEVVVDGKILGGAGADAEATAIATKLRKWRVTGSTVSLTYGDAADDAALELILSSLLSNPFITTLKVSYSVEDFVALTKALSSVRAAAPDPVTAPPILLACLELTAADFDVFEPLLDTWLSLPGLRAVRLHAYRGAEAAATIASDRIFERLRASRGAPQLAILAWPGNAVVSRAPWETFVEGEVAADAAWADQLKVAAERAGADKGAAEVPRPPSPVALPRVPAVARLRIVGITDTYMLDNFPHLKTMLDEFRADKSATTICVHNGDFLMPYLLSSLDGGRGMMSMINATVDYIIWGNHETDLDHKQVLECVAGCRATLLNSNMTAHASFGPHNTHHKAFDVVRFRSPDGTNSRSVGLLGILTNDKVLYKEGAFGGAVIEDPWAAMCKYRKILEQDEKVDLVVPLCHLYEHQDERTCTEFDFPLVLSGHDHHKMNKIVGGSRLLKAGSDAHFAVVVDLSWPDARRGCRPKIDATHVRVDEWPPHTELQAKMKSACAPLERFKSVKLCHFPPEYRPVSSVNPRSGRRTFCTWFCDQVLAALNADSGEDAGRPACDAVFIKGANFPNGYDYGDDEAFTMERLMCEIENERSAVLVVRLPGSVLYEAVKQSWQKPNPHWFQFDSHCNATPDGGLTTVAKQPLDLDRVYLIASCLNVRSPGMPLLHEYFQAHPGTLPPEEAALRPHSLLMQHFRRRNYQEQPE